MQGPCGKRGQSQNCPEESRGSGKAMPTNVQDTKRCRSSREAAARFQQCRGCKRMPGDLSHDECFAKKGSVTGRVTEHWQNQLIQQTTFKL